MPTHRPAGLEIFDEAQTIVRRTQEIAAPPSVVFASLASPEDWKRWAGLDITYLTDAPHGIGTRRTARPGPLPGVEERFFVWAPDHRLSFHAVASPLPVGVFAEDYLLEELPGGHTRLTWTLALDGGFPPARSLVAIALAGLFGQGLPKLADALAQRVPVAA